MKSRTKKRMQKGGVYYDTLPEFIKSTDFGQLNPFENDDLRKSAYYDDTIPYYKKRERTNTTIRNIVSREESNIQEKSERERATRMAEIAENPDSEITHSEYMEMPYNKQKLWKESRRNGSQWDPTIYYKKRKVEDTVIGRYNKLMQENNYKFYLSEKELRELQDAGITQSFVAFNKQMGMQEYHDYYRLRFTQDNEIDKLEKELKTVDDEIAKIYGPEITRMNGKNLYYLKQKANTNLMKRDYLKKTEQIKQRGLIEKQTSLTAKKSELEKFMRNFTANLKPIMTL